MYASIDIYFFRIQAEKDDKLVMQDIRKCVQKIGKSTVETTAYYRALGEKKGLNLAKYRDQVESELSVEKSSKKGKIK